MTPLIFESPNVCCPEISKYISLLTCRALYEYLVYCPTLPHILSSILFLYFTYFSISSEITNHSPFLISFFYCHTTALVNLMHENFAILQLSSENQKIKMRRKIVFLVNRKIKMQNKYFFNCEIKMRQKSGLLAYFWVSNQSTYF